MTDISTHGATSAPVYCQISGRDISPESCRETQGQKGCFGCAAHTRRCESCMINYVAVAATGTCSECTRAEIEREQDIKVKAPPAKVQCQAMKRMIAGSMCRASQGQESCRGCAAESRLCENCGERPVRFAQYGTCFTCSVKEFGDDWQPEGLDRSIAHPHLRVVPDRPSTEGASGKPIELIAHDLRRIPLANIRDPGVVLRMKFDEGELVDLGVSMAEDGMIYPVILEPVDENFFEVIIGDRRVRAARLREEHDIPAFIVSPQSPLMKILMATAENIQRVQLDPFEEARVFLRLMREYDFDTATVAKRVKRSTHHVQTRLQLLSLSEDVQQLVAEGEISLSNATALARVPDQKQQTRLAKAGIRHRLVSGEFRRKIRDEIGEMDKERVIPYRVTAEKFALRTIEFTQWYRRAAPRLAVTGASPDERREMLEALASLENEVGKLKALIKTGRSAVRRTKT